MGFWTGLRNLLGVVGPVASGMAGKKFPEYAVLIEMGWRAVYELEELFPPGNGDRKAGMWMQSMTSSMPDIVLDIETATGKRLVDENLLASGLADLREAQVKIMKAFREPGL